VLILTYPFLWFFAVSLLLLAHGVDHLRDWPLVTLSSFQQRASTARKNSGALYIHINPYVNEDTRAEWEEYAAVDEDGWM